MTRGKRFLLPSMTARVSPPGPTWQDRSACTRMPWHGMCAHPTSNKGNLIICYNYIRCMYLIIHCNYGHLTMYFLLIHFKVIIKQELLSELVILKDRSYILDLRTEIKFKGSNSAGKSHRPRHARLGDRRWLCRRT